MSEPKPTYTVTQWHGCYNDSWNGVLVPEAYSHPAKFAPGLISRILRHMLERGYIAPGDSVVDPFGGVGLGGLDAASFGLHWIGVELEQDFVILAHKNINQWMNKEWCNCGQESRAYLCSMREEVSKRAKRGQSEEGENGAILQPELQQQLSLFGQGTEQGAPGENEGAHTLERGQGTLGGNESENSGEGQAENRREESKLEGGADAQRGWVLGDPAKWSVQNGTRPHYGATYWTPPKSERGSSSQEWRQDGQPVRESSGDDSLGAYETPSPRGSCQQPATDHMRDLRQDVSGIAPPENVQRRVQAGKAARVSATIRRQEEGARCLVCGRLIAPPPIVLQGDSRRLVEVVGGGMCAAVSSPPYDSNTVHSDARAQERHSEKGGQLGRWGMHLNGVAVQGDYGSTPGQLGSMPSGDYAAAVSSPPYADNAATWVEGPGARHDTVHHNGDNSFKASSDSGYGSTPGNVGNMRDGGFEAAVSSQEIEWCTCDD